MGKEKKKKRTLVGDRSGNGESSHGEDGSDDGGELHFRKIMFR